VTHNIAETCSDKGFHLAEVAKVQAFNELVRRLTFPASPPRIDRLGVEIHPPANLQ
jgi:hypothetical protein